MNKERRKILDDMVEKISSIGLVIDEVAESERESFNSMNEGLQATQRGQSMEEAADCLEEASGLLEEVVEYIHQAQGG